LVLASPSAKAEVESVIDEMATVTAAASDSVFLNMLFPSFNTDLYIVDKPQCLKLRTGVSVFIID
jgi:hypothetical protein